MSGFEHRLIQPLALIPTLTELPREIKVRTLNKNVMKIILGDLPLMSAEGTSRSKANTRVLISPYHGQEGNKQMFMSAWREFPSVPCIAGGKNLMTARVSMLLKSRKSLIFFRACFLPGRVKDLSAPTYSYSGYIRPLKYIGVQYSGGVVAYRRQVQPISMHIITF